MDQSHHSENPPGPRAEAPSDSAGVAPRLVEAPAHLPRDTAPIISLRGISRSFAAGDEAITVLRNVDLDIWPGELVAIIGASGSGKSTLMNVLGCLDRPSAGSYHFNGEDVGGLGPDQQARLRREHFGFIFQRYQLLGDLDAVGNVAVPAIYAGEGRATREARAKALLTQLGLGARLDHRPSELSGGQQQRVSVARALMNGGEVILADEPTGALDTRSSAELIALLETLNSRGHTIIMVTHDPEVAAHAHRVIEISDGEIVADRRRSDPAAAADVANEAPAAPPSPLPPRGKAGFLSGAMRLSEAFDMALLAMLSHRLRSFLTMLGIIIGIASVVLVVALGSGSQEKVLENISSLGTNTITVRAGSGFGSRGASRIQTLIPADAEAIKLLPEAAGVSPGVSTQATLRHGSTEASSTINGVSNDYFRLHAYDTVAGTLFESRDILELGQVAVIDEATRDTFFGVGGNALGEVMHLGRVPVKVIGVVKAKGMTFGPSSLNVFLPYTTVMSRISGQGHLSTITVQIGEDHDTTSAQAAIQELLLARHGTEDFFLQNADTIRETITSTTRTMTLLVAAIAVISLVVGGIGVMNIMLVSVTERTREIGVRVAIGARRSDIVAQFLIEAVLVCLVGGALGIGLALGGGALIQSLSGDAVRLSFSTLSIVVAALSSSVIGVSFGYLPARAAARLDPVVALSRD